MCKLKAKSHSYKRRSHTQKNKLILTAWKLKSTVNKDSMASWRPGAHHPLVIVIVFVSSFAFVSFCLCICLCHCLSLCLCHRLWPGAEDPALLYDHLGVQGPPWPRALLLNRWLFFCKSFFSTIELIDSELTNCFSRFLYKKKLADLTTLDLKI